MPRRWESAKVTRSPKHGIGDIGDTSSHAIFRETGWLDAEIAHLPQRIALVLRLLSFELLE
jgi:hypothetical protein